MRGYACIVCVDMRKVCVCIYALSMHAYICAKYACVYMRKVCVHIYARIVCTYFVHMCAQTLRIYARIFNLFLADTDAYLADGYGKYARIFGMRGNPK